MCENNRICVITPLSDISDYRDESSLGVVSVSLFSENILEI